MHHIRWTACLLIVLPLGARGLGAQRPDDASSYAGTQVSHGITLQAAITLALRHNPDMMIARSLVDSARSEHRIARALPNPTLFGNPNTPYQYGISIPLDVSPARVYRSRSTAVGVQAVEADRADVGRQTTLAVARAFFDVLLTRERERLATERRDQVRRLLAADSLRVRTGDLPRQNLARSEVEMARSDADVARSEVDFQLARTSLRGLIGTPHDDTSFAVLGTLDYRRLDPPPDSLLAIAFSHRPDLVASAYRVTQSRVAERSAAALNVPVPVLSFVRQYTAPFESGHYYSLGLSFELPSVNLHGGERARAAAGAEIAAAVHQRVEVQLDRDVNASLAQFRIQRTLVERFEAGLLSRVDASVEAARYAYSRGATSLLDVLDAVRSQQDVRTDYYTALHDYWVSAFALNAAVGTDVFNLAGSSR